MNDSLARGGCILGWQYLISCIYERIYSKTVSVLMRCYVAVGFVCAHHGPLIAPDIRRDAESWNVTDDSSAAPFCFSSPCGIPEHDSEGGGSRVANAVLPPLDGRSPSGYFHVGSPIPTGHTHVSRSPFR